MDKRTAVSADSATADLWDQAYGRVDAYLTALGVYRAILRHRLARRVLTQPQRRPPVEAPVQAAMEHLREDILAWMQQFVCLSVTDADEAFLESRVALLLADMPGQWHSLFLADQPLPESFAAALRERLEWAPRFRPARMEIRPLDLGLVPHLAEAALHTLERTPFLRLLIVWAFFISFFGLLFYFTR